MKKFFLLATIALVGCTQMKYGISNANKKYAETFTENRNVKFGIPLGSDQNKKQLYEREEFVFHYTPAMGASQWVSYRLTANDFGDTKRRRGKFLADPLIPGAHQITHEHYTHSGYDRGHMVRSMERTASPDSNMSTFYMTNVFPQTPDLNRGVWLSFERFCEKLAAEGYELYLNTGGIYCNSVFLKDEQSVQIPDSCFKTVLAVDTSGNIDFHEADTFTVAVVMPNSEGIRGENWQKYARTVRSVEKSTGFNFYPLLPKKRADFLETMNYVP